MIKGWINKLKGFFHRTNLVKRKKYLFILVPVIGFLFWYFTRARVAIRLYYYLPSFLKVNDKLLYVYQDEILYFYIVTLVVVWLMLLIGEMVPTPITLLKEKGWCKCMLYGTLSFLIFFASFWLLIFLIRFVIGLVIFVTVISILWSEFGSGYTTYNNYSNYNSTDAYDREREKREKEFEFIRYVEDKKKRDREGRW